VSNLYLCNLGNSADAPQVKASMVSLEREKHGNQGILSTQTIDDADEPNADFMGGTGHLANVKNRNGEHMRDLFDS
jgi:hypothetical protein